MVIFCLSCWHCFYLLLSWQTQRLRPFLISFASHRWYAEMKESMLTNELQIVRPHLTTLFLLKLPLFQIMLFFENYSCHGSITQIVPSPQSSPICKLGKLVVRYVLKSFKECFIIPEQGRCYAGYNFKFPLKQIIEKGVHFVMTENVTILKTVCIKIC